MLAPAQVCKSSVQSNIFGDVPVYAVAAFPIAKLDHLEEQRGWEHRAGERPVCNKEHITSLNTISIFRSLDISALVRGAPVAVFSLMQSLSVPILQVSLEIDRECTTIGLRSLLPTPANDFSTDR